MANARITSIKPEVLGQIAEGIQKLNQWQDDLGGMLASPEPEESKARKRWNDAKRIIGRILAAYIFISTQFGFVGFIGEEALQTAGFSGFGFIESASWDELRTHTIPTQIMIYEWYTATLGISVETVQRRTPRVVFDTIELHHETVITHTGWGALCAWDICLDIPWLLNPIMIPAYRKFGAAARDQILSNWNRVLMQK